MLNETPIGQTRANVTNPFTQTKISSYRPSGGYDQSHEYQPGSGQVGDSYAYTLSHPMPTIPPPTTGDFGAQHQANQMNQNNPYQQTSDESYSDDEGDSDSDTSELDDYGEDDSSDEESSYTEYEPSKKQMTYYSQ